MIQNEHVYAIYCRPEVAVDVISGGNVKTIECYVVVNFEAASVSLKKLRRHKQINNI